MPYLDPNVKVTTKDIRDFMSSKDGKHIAKKYKHYTPASIISAMRAIVKSGKETSSVTLDYFLKPRRIGGLGMGQMFEQKESTMKINKLKIKERILVGTFIDRVLTEADHGFDTTMFRKNGFQKVLAVANIKPEKMKQHRHGWFVWSGAGISITTYNNPITGEYNNPKQRKNEKDFAGYIGISGNDDIVAKVVKTIKKNAKYIKDESPGERDFI